VGEIGDAKSLLFTKAAQGQPHVQLKLQLMCSKIERWGSIRFNSIFFTSYSLPVALAQ
jgi:hypothetical protein